MIEEAIAIPLPLRDALNAPYWDALNEDGTAFSAVRFARTRGCHRATNAHAVCAMRELGDGERRRAADQLGRISHCVPPGVRAATTVHCRRR